MRNDIIRTDVLHSQPGANMSTQISPGIQKPEAQMEDEYLFGWDPTPGIVSVWADRTGRALVWQRSGDEVRCSASCFRPWILAAHLDDLRHLGPALVKDAAGTGDAPFSYRELGGPTGSLCYLLSAR